MALVATPGAADANSYETLVEAQAYFAVRFPIAEWTASLIQEALLIMSTRVLDSMAIPRRRLYRTGTTAYYITNRAWTGAPATATQALAWPRTGMFDALGRAIDPTIIPQALKDAESELAGQLAKGDRTLDNDVIAQGLTSLRAGSVALSFKDGIWPQVIPDAVWSLMPASWFTDELYEPAMRAEFDVLS